MTETYENIRDNSDIVPQDVRRQWIEADQSERMLRQTYERIEQDQDITAETKARKATEAYEQYRTSRIAGAAWRSSKRTETPCWSPWPVCCQRPWTIS